MNPSTLHALPKGGHSCGFVRLSRSTCYFGLKAPVSQSTFIRYIEAGWATFVVWLFAQWFYRHRQLRRRQVARRLVAAEQRAADGMKNDKPRFHDDGR